MPVLNASAIASAAVAGGFTGADVPISVGVALAESSGNSDAMHTNSNGTVDYGLWQINSVHSDVLARGNWRDPVDNARMAKAVKDGSGWNAWVTYKNGTAKAKQPRNLTDLIASGLSPALGLATGGKPSGLLGGIGSAISAQAGVVSGAAKALGALTSHDFWIRAGEIVGALLLLIIGLVLFLGKDVAKTATSAKGLVP